MNFSDIIDFFNSFSTTIEDKDLTGTTYLIAIIVNLILGILFFLFRDLSRKENGKKINIFNIIILSGINFAIGCIILLICGINSILFAPIIGFISSIYIEKKLLKEKSSNNNNEASSTENNINVTVNNNLNDNERLVPNFYNPKVELPEGMTINDLDIVKILELYGYISSNQKFKMIKNSLFETTDEQIEKLLTMCVLEDKEYKEAKAILNLIKLNNRIVSKEEALKFILEQETAENSSSNHIENN